MAVIARSAVKKIYVELGDAAKSENQGPCCESEGLACSDACI